MKTLFAILLSTGVAAPHAIPHATREGAWKDENGKATPNTDFRKSIQGFGGWLVVTPDQDWAEKWETPSVVTPRFSEADTVLKGGRIFVLIFFSNPALSPNGTIDVRCDLEVMRPDKTYSMQHKDLECASGPLSGPAYNVYLSNKVVGFVGEEKDQPGKWLVRITLKDNVRKVSMPLYTSFTLKDG